MHRFLLTLNTINILCSFYSNLCKKIICGNILFKLKNDNIFPAMLSDFPSCYFVAAKDKEMHLTCTAASNLNLMHHSWVNFPFRDDLASFTFLPIVHCKWRHSYAAICGHQLHILKANFCLNLKLIYSIKLFTSTEKYYWYGNKCFAFNLFQLESKSQN